MSTIQQNKLDEVIARASEIMEKTAEAAGTIKMLDMYLEETDTIDAALSWSLRNVLRNIEGATDDAAKVVEVIETIQRGKNNVQ